MNITVLGCGRWGSFHAWYAHRIGHNVTLWGRPGSPHLAELISQRQNEYLHLPLGIALTADLTAALAGADIVIISISAQQLRSLAKQIRATRLTHMPFVLCMKGLEKGSGKRLSTVMKEELGEDVRTVVWVGPGHVQEFLSGIADIFSSSLIRFYYGTDLLGTEIGAAAKNVYGIAAGMLDGFHYSSLKGALMARGTHELSRLVAAMGGSAMTVYGLSHLGDYEATLFSQHSNNRRFGEDFILQKPFHKLAEGVYTCEALMDLSSQWQVELPITQAIYDIIFQHKDPAEELRTLFLRSQKEE